MDGVSCLAHLINRSIQPATVFKFCLGFAPGYTNAANTLLANLTGEGFELSELVLAGLVANSTVTIYSGMR